MKYNGFNFKKIKKKSLRLLFRLLTQYDDYYERANISECLKTIKNKKLFQTILRIEFNLVVDEITISAHMSQITCLIKLNNWQIVSGGLDGIVQVWDINNIKIQKAKTIENNLDRIESIPNRLHKLSLVSINIKTNVKSLVRFSENQVIIGTVDGFIYLWNLDDKKKKSFKINGSVNCLIRHNKTTIISGCINFHSIKVWDMSKLTVVREFDTYNHSFSTLIKLNSNQIISGGILGDRSKLWDVWTGTCIKVLEIGGQYNIIKLSKELIISVSFMGLIKVWNVKKNSCIANFCEYHAYSLSNCVTKMNSNSIIIVRDDSIKIWDIVKGFCVKNLYINFNVYGRIGSLIKLNERQIVYGNEKGILKIIDI